MLGGACLQDVLSTKELPVSSDDDSPGGTLGSINISVAQHPVEGLSPLLLQPQPSHAHRDGVLTKRSPCFFPPHPSIFGSSGICMAAA